MFNFINNFFTELRSTIVHCLNNILLINRQPFETAWKKNAPTSIHSFSSPHYYKPLAMNNRLLLDVSVTKLIVFDSRCCK